MEKVRKSVKKFREAINPPYHPKDLPHVLLTLVVLIFVPVAVLWFFDSDGPSSQASAVNDEIKIKLTL